MPSRTLLMLLVATVGMIAGGCGSDSPGRRDSTKPDSMASYEASVRSVHADMDAAMSAAFATGRLDAARVRAARETAQEAAETMESAHTPQRYEAAHDEYALGLETFVDILGDVEAQVDDPNVASRHLKDERFTTGVSHLERATKLYEDAGLTLG